MSIFKKKKKNMGDINLVLEHSVPCRIPTISGIENYHTSGYSLNNEAFLEAQYNKSSENLNDVIKTLDRYSSGTEHRKFVRSQMEHLEGLHQAEVAINENQSHRIRTMLKMYAERLKRNIADITKKIDKSTHEIEPLESLTTQFSLKLGKHMISVGSLVTIGSLIVDTIVNYSYYQSVFLQNKYMLWITVICLAIMSDVTMWCLATLINRKEEDFMPKKLYNLACGTLLSFFIISVITTVGVRFGTMASTFGTVDVSGNFVGKESYSLAEYAATLASACVTAVTGVLSFILSLDKHAHKVAIREQKKMELAQLLAEREILVDDLALVEKTCDPQVRDMAMRAAAEYQFHALQKGLMLRGQKEMIAQINDSGFTERIAAMEEEKVPIPSPNGTVSTATINLNKVG